MKKLWLFPLLIVALVLAACADGGVGQTPGAIGTEPILATEPGLATEPVEPTMAATEAVAPTTEATLAATEAGTPVGVATTEATVGLVAVPFAMFEVAQAGTGTGDDGTGTGAVTPAGATADAAGTQIGTVEPASTADPAATADPAGTAAPAGTADVTTGTQTAGEDEALLVRGTDLLGSEIVAANGDTVGTVDEVLVDDTGMIQYVVFDAANFVEGAGIGTGAEPAGTAAPIGTLDNSTQVVGTLEAVTPEGESTAAASTQPAGTAEAISTSTVGEGTAIAQEGMEGTGALADENTVLIFNGTADDLETQAVMLTDDMLSAEGVSFATTGTDVPADMAMLEGLLRVSRLTDFEVMNAQDETLGQVEDWIVDLRQGMVSFGVVDFGGFLGLAENTVAVPWEQFTVNAGAAADPSLRLDVTEDTLQNAPQLDTGAWPSWPEAIPNDWETETRTFWETAS